jgi:very-short-patch-repair endonuclease
MAYRLSGRMPRWKKALAKKFAKKMTAPERTLWERLKEKGAGVWIYKQRPMLGYIVDFWCPCGIVIEVDGPCHESRRAADARRDEIFARKGIKTLRFSDKEVESNPAAVVCVIRDTIAKRMEAR